MYNVALNVLTKNDDIDDDKLACFRGSNAQFYLLSPCWCMRVGRSKWLVLIHCISLNPVFLFQSLIYHKTFPV